MFKASVITVSDKGYAGERVDTAGPLAAELLREAGYDVLTVSIVPDERSLIEAELRRHADELGAALVLTTGGTALVSGTLRRRRRLPFASGSCRAFRKRCEPIVCRLPTAPCSQELRRASTTKR
jgi:nucleotide-binding universal stress UspA family protein